MSYQSNLAGELDDTVFLKETANQSNEAFVQALYRKYLMREVDVQGYRHFFSLLTNGQRTR